jgi:Flp pilus assembly protein TadB
MPKTPGWQFIAIFAGLIVLTCVVVTIGVLVHLTALGVAIVVFVLGLPIVLYPGLHSMKKNRRRIAERREHAAR